MAERRARGSIIYETLIVLLTAALIGSIVYPKKLWDQMKRETDECRARMSSIFDGELQYQKFRATYTDSLPELVTFLKSDSAYWATIDSVIVRPLRQAVADLDTIVMRQRAFVEAIKLDTTQAYRDSLADTELEILSDYRFIRADIEDLLDVLKAYPMMPREQLRRLWVQMGTEDYITQFNIAQNMLRLGEIDASLIAAERVANAIGEIEPGVEAVIDMIYNTGPLLDQIYTCPAIGDTYKLVLEDTTVFKYINIYCPVDSVDIEAVKRDFLRYRIGGYRLENHGKIERGVKSWETQS
jgi:hypothetical protein